MSTYKCNTARRSLRLFFGGRKFPPTCSLPRADYHNGGFTLLEVMIALAILAIALTSLFGSQSSSVSLAAESRFNTQAPLLAELQLAHLNSAETLESDSGDFGNEFPGYRWEATVEEASFPDSELLQQLDGKLLHLTLVVFWGEDLYSYRLESYRRNSQ